jgi:hypothetical protein
MTVPLHLASLQHRKCSLTHLRKLHSTLSGHLQCTAWHGMTTLRESNGQLPDASIMPAVLPFSVDSSTTPSRILRTPIFFLPLHASTVDCLCLPVSSTDVRGPILILPKICPHPQNIQPQPYYPGLPADAQRSSVIMRREGSKIQTRGRQLGGRGKKRNATRSGVASAERGWLDPPTRPQISQHVPIEAWRCPRVSSNPA